MAKVVRLSDWRKDKIFLNRLVDLAEPPKISGLALMLTLSLAEGFLLTDWLKSLRWTVKDLQTGRTANSSTVYITQRSSGLISLKIEPLFPSLGQISGHRLRVSVTAPSGAVRCFHQTKPATEKIDVRRKVSPSITYLKLIES
ncbi:MAG: hypothetical protein V1738_00985 [Patescibacteria group bacterium]